MKRIFTWVDLVHAVPWFTGAVFRLDTKKKYSVEIKEHHEKRSLDANAYAWKLLSMIAEKMSAEGAEPYTADEIYIIMLKRYGQSGIIKIRDKDAENIVREFRYYEKHEALFDRDAAYYRVWVGSSNYNTKEMAEFIDGIVTECRDLGIETLTPPQISVMMDKWGKA